jgi:hypothetical protein
MTADDRGPPRRVFEPPRLLAAIVMGSTVAPPPAPFDLATFIVAMIVHFIMAAVFAIVLAWIIDRLTASAAIAVGLVFGLALYLVNFHLWTAVFPWFAMARNWVTVFNHVLFGGVAGWSYHVLASTARRRVA